MSERRPVLEWRSTGRRDDQSATVGVFELVVECGSAPPPRWWWSVYPRDGGDLMRHGSEPTLLASQLAAEDAAREAGIAVPLDGVRCPSCRRCDVLTSGDLWSCRTCGHGWGPGSYEITPEDATFRERIEAALNVTGYDDDYLVSEVERNALRVIEAAKQETVQANLLAAAKAVCAAQIIDDRIEVLIGLRERVRAHFYDVRFERTDAVISELQSVRDQIKNDLTARSTATEVDRSVKPAGDGRTGGDASAEAAP